MFDARLFTMAEIAASCAVTSTTIYPPHPHHDPSLRRPTPGYPKGLAPGSSPPTGPHGRRHGPPTPKINLSANGCANVPQPRNTVPRRRDVGVRGWLRGPQAVQD